MLYLEKHFSLFDVVKIIRYLEFKKIGEKYLEFKKELQKIEILKFDVDKN